MGYLLVRKVARGALFKPFDDFDALEDLVDTPGRWKVQRAIAAVEAAAREPHEGRLGLPADDAAHGELSETPQQAGARSQATPPHSANGPVAETEEPRDP